MSEKSFQDKMREVATGYHNDEDEHRIINCIEVDDALQIAKEADQTVAEARSIMSRLVELDRIGLEGMDDDIERQEKYMHDSFVLMEEIKVFLAKGLVQK